MPDSWPRKFRLLFKRLPGSRNYYANYSGVAKTDLGRMSIYRQLKESIGPKTGEILDVGCGIGYVTHFLGARGVDTNSKAIALAKECFPTTRFESCGLKDLSPRKKYSAIVMVNVLEHLEDEEREEILDLLPRFLDPEGRCYFVYDNMYHPLQLFSILLHPGMLLTDPTHVYCWPHGKFRRLLEQKFRIVSFKKGNILSRLLPFTNHFFTAGLYVCEPISRD